MYNVHTRNKFVTKLKVGSDSVLAVQSLIKEKIITSLRNEISYLNNLPNLDLLIIILNCFEKQ